MVKIFVAVPAYQQLAPQALDGLSAPSSKHQWHRKLVAGSLLPHTFNQLWTIAYNTRAQYGWTHFVMHHADVEAPPEFADELVDELDRTGADVISSVIPIKDHRGLTTTGYMDPHTKHITRFTMHEACRLPQTFDLSDTDVPSKWLMVNTGLWVCDFTRPWVDDFPGFAIQSCVRSLPNGMKQAAALSEDWNWSMWAAQHGVRIKATRRVPVLHHFGNSSYTNVAPWGDWKTDLGDDYAERMRAEEQQEAARQEAEKRLHGSLNTAHELCAV
jgi:hypothetical protein